MPGCGGSAPPGPAWKEPALVGSPGSGLMLPCAHEILLKTLFMKTIQSLITLLHKYFDVAMLIPEVSDSLQHQLDSKLCLASSVFPVLSTTLKKNLKPFWPVLSIGVWAWKTKRLLPIAAGARGLNEGHGADGQVRRGSVEESPGKADGANAMAWGKSVCSSFPGGVAGKMGFEQAREKHCKS